MMKTAKCATLDSGNLGKRSGQQRMALRDNSPNDMEAQLQRLQKENDKLKSQLSESQEEASLSKISRFRTFY
jgi:hypothetical protein